MIFDRLCAIAERHMEELKPLLDCCALFSLEKPAHEVARGSLEEQEVEFLNESFFLPFNTVAVEDPGSCVLLGNTEEEQRGMERPRFFLECLPFDQMDEEGFAQGTSGPWVEQMREDLPGGCIIHAGEVKAGVEPATPQTPSRWNVGGRLDWIYVASKERVAAGPIRAETLAQGDYEGMRHSALTNAVAALEELWEANTPHRFVLEATPVKQPKRNSKKAQSMVPRSHQRPVYTLLTPEAIRERLGLAHPEGTGRSVRPHERRRHFRTFKSPRFTQMRGKSVVIPATWVGPSEKTVSKHHYKVRLDL